MAACQLVAVVVIVVASLSVCLSVSLSVNKSLVTCSCNLAESEIDAVQFVLELLLLSTIFYCILWYCRCFFYHKTGYKIYGFRFTTHFAPFSL